MHAAPTWRMVTLVRRFSREYTAGHLLSQGTGPQSGSVALGLGSLCGTAALSWQCNHQASAVCQVHCTTIVRMAGAPLAAGGTSSSSAGPGDVPVETAHKRGDFDAERELDAAMLPVEVKEQRLSGLLQSLLCGACLGALCRAQGAVLLRGAGLRSRSVDTAIEAAASGRLMGAALAAAPGLAVEA